MGSASSPVLRSCEPRLATPSIGPRWKLVSLLSLLLVLIVAVRPRLAAGAISASLLIISCYFWKQHLDSAGVSRAWSLLVSLLLFWELMAAVLRGPTSAGMFPSALGCYLLSYLMIWTLAAQDSDVHLQALATAALLLSAIIFARPAVLISAVFLSATAAMPQKLRWRPEIRASHLYASGPVCADVTPITQVGS
jgi:hypothetical protein